MRKGQVGPTRHKIPQVTGGYSMSDFLKLSNNLPFIIGLREPLSAEQVAALYNTIVKTIPASQRPVEMQSAHTVSEYISSLAPFVVEQDGLYTCDIATIRSTLTGIYAPIMDKLLPPDTIKRLVTDKLPGHTVAPWSKVEDAHHQEYIYLYRQAQKDLSDVTTALDRLNNDYKAAMTAVETLKIDNRAQTAEIAKNEAVIDGLKDANKALKQDNDNLQTALENQGNGGNLSDAISKMLSAPVIISDIRACDAEGNEITAVSDVRAPVCMSDIAQLPAVYGTQRPSFYEGVGTPLTGSNVALIEARDTQQVLKKRLFGKKKILSDKNLHAVDKAAEIDLQRRQAVTDLLNSHTSNNKKYLKYLLLTPGMPDNYISTLNKAAELGVDANTVIELFESPAGACNISIIEHWISNISKGYGYNIKKELAEELVAGQWKIISDYNGDPVEYVLVPVAKLNDTIDDFRRAVLSGDTSKKVKIADPEEKLSAVDKAKKEEVEVDEDENEIVELSGTEQNLNPDDFELPF